MSVLEAHLREMIRDAVRDIIRQELKTPEVSPPREEQGAALLTVREVASALKVTQCAVREWIGQGLLGVEYAGSRVRIRRAALDAFLKRKDPESVDIERKVGEIVHFVRSKRGS